MANHRKRDSTEPRKFTLSCSRCRASKLKCDRQEPCMECVKRDLGHLCTKDERQPRAKRAKIAEAESNETKESESEETAKLLEHFAYGTNANGPSCVAPDYSNAYWLNPGFQRHNEKLALVREIVDSMPDVDVIHALSQVFVTRCQAPLGNIVHAPSFIGQTERFCDCLGFESPESRTMALLDIFSMDALAAFLLSLAVSLAFHPTPSLLGWSATSQSLRVEELRASDTYTKTWRSLALRCLQGSISLFCGSIPSLQAAVMLLLDDQDDSLALDIVLVTAISGAQKLGLHRLGDARLETTATDISGEPSCIRTEIGIRTWWALVMRDWSRGQTLGYYTIQPSQFNTRMPLHINDEGLCPATCSLDANGYITERPRSEFTMLSYTIHALEIAIMVRESIDFGTQTQRPGIKSQDHLNKKYEQFISGLPSHFRLGSSIGIASTGPMAAIPVHRWMLHQQLWSFFLRLHRNNPSTQNTRSICQLLAQNIISTHAEIQARCSVCGSLSSNETQLFSAAVVLLMGLLFSEKETSGSAGQLGQIMARDKVREAIELLKNSDRSESVELSPLPSVAALEALMKLEDEPDPNDKRSPISLKNKVKETLQTIQTSPQSTATTENTSIEASTPVNLDILPPVPEFQDLDILPMLFNDPICDFWEFLDFTPSTAKEDLLPLG